MCVHVFKLICVSAGVCTLQMQKAGGFDFSGLKPTLFLCACTVHGLEVCIFESVGTKGFTVTQSLPSVSGHLKISTLVECRGVFCAPVCVFVYVHHLRQMICDPIICLTHSSQELPLGYNSMVFTAALSPTCMNKLWYTDLLYQGNQVKVMSTLLVWGGVSKHETFSLLIWFKCLQPYCFYLCCQISLLGGECIKK